MLGQARDYCQGVGLHFMSGVRLPGVLQLSQSHNETGPPGGNPSGP
jgi:hypothetical protein